VTVNAVEIICKKRDGAELRAEEISWIVSSYTAGSVAPEQMSAFCMAVLFAGMTDRETADLTKAYVSSGSVLNWDTAKPLCDKHSTGGVGDKVTLVLTPLAVACGMAVPQLSGRGLGHTGGTLDKLESIPGWRCDLTLEEMRNAVLNKGGVIASASRDLAPADKLIYALRDVTGTVESVPLIAASIMSKKIAEGTKSLVLDVKTGSGAFMKTPERASLLAETMVEIGRSAGVRTSAYVTGMSSPLGRSAGNAVEVLEALECLSGGGPSDLREITLTLAEEMLRLSGIKMNPEHLLDNGSALGVFESLVANQEGRLSEGLKLGSSCYEVRATEDGYVSELDAMSIGLAAWRLGAGRSKPGDMIDYGAGVTWAKGVGDFIKAGEVMFKLYTNDASKITQAVAALEGSVSTTSVLLPREDIVLDYVGYDR
jgi:thymidine phosphorylase